MKRFSVRSSIFLVLALGSTMPAFAVGISYTCDPNIDAAFAGTCSTLNGSIAGLYNATFTNANASIYIQYGATGLGQSEQYYNSATYTDYRTALINHESGANDVTAVSNVPVGEPGIFGTGRIDMTGALAAALGLSGAIGITSGGGQCSLGFSGCYNGLVTLGSGSVFYYRSGTQPSNAYDIYSVVEHETDEVLGTSSCIGTSSNLPADVCGGGTGVSPVDLFRYSAAGTRSFVSQGNGTLAYFSINGGTTPIADYINSTNSGDYGDWSSSCLFVQDATGCPGHSFDITTDGRVEIAALDAVGYNLTAAASAPEPGTLGMFGFGFAALGAFAYRRRRNQSPH